MLPWHSVMARVFKNAMIWNSCHKGYLYMIKKRLLISRKKFFMGLQKRTKFNWGMGASPIFPSLPHPVSQNFYVYKSSSFCELWHACFLGSFLRDIIKIHLKIPKKFKRRLMIFRTWVKNFFLIIPKLYGSANIVQFFFFNLVYEFNFTLPKKPLNILTKILRSERLAHCNPLS